MTYVRFSCLMIVVSVACIIMTAVQNSSPATSCYSEDDYACTSKERRVIWEEFTEVMIRQGEQEIVQLAKKQLGRINRPDGLVAVEATHLAGYPATFYFNPWIAREIKQTIEEVRKAGFELRIHAGWQASAEHEEGNSVDVAIFKDGEKLFPRSGEIPPANLFEELDAIGVLLKITQPVDKNYTVVIDPCGHEETWTHIVYRLKRFEIDVQDPEYFSFPTEPHPHRYDDGEEYGSEQ